ncbi:MULTISPECIES: hypothetical protein [unclassified Knoellia]|uniref:hypothetical protein n=1 Tax=Knoellia altitudinis TaxID=3404795 RepID=UPI00361F0747
MTAVAYAGLLAFVTERFIAEPFAYLGFVHRPVGALELVLWVVSSGALGAMAFRRWALPSHSAFAFLLATVALPVVTVPTFWGQLESWGLFVLQLTTLVAFALMRVILRGDRIPWRGVVVPPRLFWLALASATTGAMGYLFLSTGISPTFLNLSDVYSQREEFSGSITSVGAYLVGWVGAGILPGVLATGLYRRNATITGSAVVAIALLYSMTGYKSYLVGVALTIAAYVLTAVHRRGGHWWITTFGGIVAVAALLDSVRGGFTFTTLLVRRALATAGLNTASYVDFFDSNERYGLRHSVLSFTGQPPYDLSPARLIGLEAYGNATVAANVNFIGDGYANFGITGVLVMATVLAIYLRCVDKATMHLPLQVSAPALTLFLIAASNTAALTVLSTHGGLVLLALMLTMPSFKDPQVETRKERRTITTRRT